jgi:spermidine synthase
MLKGDKVIERVELPDGKELRLVRWQRHVAIEVGNRTLMSTHEHASEDELGRIVGESVVGITAPRVLIGGLGLGYTLRAALDVLPAKAKVTVAELLPDVVRWNHDTYGRFAKRPLEDSRVKLLVGDVAKVMQDHKGRYDAILLDVDNGPDALMRASNAKLYTRAGLLRAKRALRPNGFLAVWSSFPSRTFTTWLRDTGFTVELLRPPPSTPNAPRAYIWLARRG